MYLHNLSAHQLLLLCTLLIQLELHKLQAYWYLYKEYMLQHRLGELGAKMAKRKMELMLPHAADLVSNTLRARPASGMLLGAAVVLAASALFGHSPRRNVASRY